jgi:tRNA(fMet)-specific endonuclease VapC
MYYMLDTDTCIYLINRRPGYEQILRHIDGKAYGDVLISAVTLAELRFGIAKSVHKEKNRIKLELFLGRFQVVDFGSVDAAAYGTVRAQLQAKGTPIGPLDTLIAAHALSLKTVLISNNVQEFSRVSGLALENWMVLEG